MKKYITLALPALLLAILACTTDEPLPSGLDALHRTGTDSLQVITLTAAEMAQYYRPVQAGLTSTLLLGNSDGVQARALVAFTNLTPVDTATVYSATLTLTQTKKWGSGGGFSCTLHRVTADWEEKKVMWADVQGKYDAVEIARFEVVSADSQTYAVTLPAELVNTWRSGGENYGLLINFSSADMLAELMSVDVTSTGYPTLTLGYINKSGEADTVTVNPSKDATLLELDAPVTHNVTERGTSRLWLDNARGCRTLLRFDVRRFPKEATIQQAYLSLPVDNALSVTPASGLGFKIVQLASDSTWQDPAAFVIDSTFTQPTGSVLATDAAIILATSAQISYMSNMVQRWTTAKAGNFGMIIESTSYGRDPGRIAIYTGVDDPRLPTLRITCSFPAAVRF